MTRRAGYDGWRRWWWAAWCLTGLAGLGAVAVVLLTPCSLCAAGEWIPPHPMTARQLTEAPAYITIPPMTIALRFVDPKEFYADKARGFTGQTQYGRGVRGCTILVPAGGLIEAWAPIGFAAFASANAGPNLAHEILHCISGLWHPEWPTILASGARVTEYYSITPPHTEISISGEDADPRRLR